MLSLLSTRQSEEDRFVQLLDEYHAAATDCEKKRLEQQIVVLVEKNFRRQLRPLVGRIFGRNAIATDKDVSCRYTAMVNQFLADKVLEQRRDEFWRAKALRDVRKWASRVITNQFRDYLRRKRRGLEILQDEIAPLVERFQDHFERHHDMSYELALERIDMWSCGDNNALKQTAEVLRYRYVDGMKPKKIAEQMGLSTKAVDNLRYRGLERLREELK